MNFFWCIGEMEWCLVKYVVKILKLFEVVVFWVVIVMKLYIGWVIGKCFCKGEKDMLKIRSKFSWYYMKNFGVLWNVVDCYIDYENVFLIVFECCK